MKSCFPFILANKISDPREMSVITALVLTTSSCTANQFRNLQRGLGWEGQKMTDMAWAGLRI